VRLLAITLITAGVGCAHAKKNDDFFDESPRPKRAAAGPQEAATPPKSFVVTAEKDDGFEETAPASVKTPSSTVSEARAYDTPPPTPNDFDAPAEKPAFTIRDVTPPKDTKPARSSPKVIEVPRETPAEPARPATVSEPPANALVIEVPKEEPARQTTEPAPEKTAQTQEPKKTAEPKETFAQEIEKPRMGVSVLAGLGANLSSSTGGKYVSALAYGVTVAWHPKFAGPFAADLSFWSSGNTSNTPAFKVDQDFSHFAARVFVRKNFSKYFYSGFGGGLLLTRTSSTFTINESSQGSLVSAAWRPGLDGSIIAGVRVSYFETRLDLRTLGRGMSRLDFLPTLSVGANF
jgi:hypothetical protein